MDDLRQPGAGLIEGPRGILLGTALAGGAGGFGGIFKLDLDGRDYQVLHSFAGGVGDGSRIRSALTAGATDVFYSATLTGGRLGYGVVFRMSVED